MGLLELITKGRGYGLDDLAHRLGMGEHDLASIPVSYRQFTVPKRGPATEAMFVQPNGVFPATRPAKP